MRNLSKGVIRKIKTFFFAQREQKKNLGDAHAKFDIELN